MSPDDRVAGRIVAVGLRRWKAHNLRPILAAAAQGGVCFVADARAAARLAPGPRDRLLVWGAAEPAGLADLVRGSGAALLRMEDGFLRSVGLGSDLIPPRSVVLDAQGIYFDATRPSALEALLRNAAFPPGLLARAAQVRALIVARGLTKYNLEPADPPRWPRTDRPVLLVPGQVETDASIALGGGAVRTNAALLAAVRAAHPDAFVVYKPHPDVLAGNRSGRLGGPGAELADHVETGTSIVACIAACDALHTITSLSGFDALLRRKPVTTWGMPFYAGWGLTDDRAAGHPALARRTRALALDELVAGALLLYPRYWNPDGAFATCEETLAALADERDRRAAERSLRTLRDGFVRRQGRKLRVLARAWLSG